MSTTELNPERNRAWSHWKATGIEWIAVIISSAATVIAIICMFVVSWAGAAAGVVAAVVIACAFAAAIPASAPERAIVENVVLVFIHSLRPTSWSRRNVRPPFAFSDSIDLTVVHTKLLGQFHRILW